MEEYRTIKDFSEGFFIEKKSRFIYSAFPVKSEDEAIKCIENVRKKYSTAKHHVYAYKVKEREIMRYSDDGEPQGTGGMPMMNVIMKLELVDLCVIVTRYFGGILLGTGGLTRAYSSGAKLAIENSGIALMRRCNLVDVELNYNIYGKVLSSICDFGGEVKDTLFLENVKVLFYIENSKTNDVFNKILEISSGKAIINVIKEEFRCIKE